MQERTLRARVSARGERHQAVHRLVHRRLPGRIDLRQRDVYAGVRPERSVVGFTPADEASFDEASSFFVVAFEDVAFDEAAFDEAVRFGISW